jgi:DNA-binding PadR family transcriptional regulator
MTHTDHRRLALLGLLHHTGANGYQLHAHASGMGIIGLKKSAAYNLLDTMVERGWLAPVQACEGVRAQKCYELTHAGRHATLGLLRTQLAQAAAPDFPSLVSLCWLDLLPPDEARALLEQRGAELVADLEAGEDRAHAGVVGKVLAHIRQVRALELDLVDELITSLNDGAEA